MSDKRTTPDPAGGTRRRKRSAPTIDLTATEVPSAATDTGSPSESPSMQEQPEAAAKSEPQPTGDQGSLSARSAWLSMPVLAGGFFGAALAAIAFGALWFILLSYATRPTKEMRNNDNKDMGAKNGNVTCKQREKL